ncbi:MAG: ribonuclease HII [Sphingomonadales bacterium]|nr:ribonuclease HII [Sphingomonadales bacterium]
MDQTKLLVPKGYIVAEHGEAGCDEAGRGCLAGPVVAAAVILDPAKDWTMLRDSKKLNQSQRESMAALIRDGALAWSVGCCSPLEIDQINILQASILAMHRALDGLTVTPLIILVDGNRFIPWRKVTYRCEIKGDGRFCSIAAAGILAKTHRDLLMIEAHHEFPRYQWNRNKGYPTMDHRKAVQQWGPSPWHRLSFRLTAEDHASFLFEN